MTGVSDQTPSASDPSSSGEAGPWDIGYSASLNQPPTS